MKAAITGVAGFIGSHLAERILSEGYHVLGLDCFTDYYSRSLKEKNLATCRAHKNFRLQSVDISQDSLSGLFDDIDVVFHLAAQAGVRASWGDQFHVYSNTNILGTQRILETARIASVQRIVYASSSSVYGDVDAFPMHESVSPRPVSPYGVSKLAGENLCRLYALNFGLSILSLRYFTVYGPRQRPDMAFHKFIRAHIQKKQPVLYGNGDQTRDFTYVSDAVEATWKAGIINHSGYDVFNIGGGSRISVNRVIELLEEILGEPLNPYRMEKQKGDVRHTAADIRSAASALGYAPRVGLMEGLANEVEWLKSICNGGVYGY